MIIIIIKTYISTLTRIYWKVDLRKLKVFIINALFKHYFTSNFNNGTLCMITGFTLRVVCSITNQHSLFNCINRGLISRIIGSAILWKCDQWTVIFVLEQNDFVLFYVSLSTSIGIFVKMQWYHKSTIVEHNWVTTNRWKRRWITLLFKQQTK